MKILKLCCYCNKTISKWGLVKVTNGYTGKSRPGHICMKCTEELRKEEMLTVYKRNPKTIYIIESLGSDKSIKKS